MSQYPRDYRGRFAPSPTGPLHFGSLVAAVGSYLQARHQQGQWLVRMEDLDRPRCVKGADSQILKTLERYGMVWDGEVMYQSQRDTAYNIALEQLEAMNACYPCACSRSEIAAIARPGSEGPIYPGTCRKGLAEGKKVNAIRTRLDDAVISFHDLLQGEITQYLFRDLGDFVIRRADSLFAYQLAVVVDDAEQGITEVVRGSDLLESTPRQIWLQQKLGYHTPTYLHLPIAVNAAGEKLSKQTFATAIDDQEPRPQLIKALNFLGQQVPGDAADSTLDDLWQWAIQHWSLAKLPATRQIPAADEQDSSILPPINN
ncbi:tRNA glutamyl-Q(34) synthetase GluQRS [Sulfuriflexus mobilis]|uniref:tRNA glutamyl-Q(34) synthetase GluQRS n=1 Tax=Sulfuriflexus mobilis TaxID=1811807 RepID=UPI000F83FC42|nr:tRNA glutamyl-Q(34) synthetase GluQRS [Sulfuriflexus mobilis]